MEPEQPDAALGRLLSNYRPVGDDETAAVATLLELVGREPQCWDRTLPLHVTASALVVHRQTRRVLLRWHDRFGRFMQVGGHGDPGESDPVAVALREATEETGLADLLPLPPTQAVFVGGTLADLVHVVVVPVPPRSARPGRPAEDAHEHGDLRFVFETTHPDAIRPESPEAELKWMSFGEALTTVQRPNLEEFLRRALVLLG